ncbi:MAG: hypothetical protein HYX75_02440 [Acidobacteria bacterium]|nr:hypothetical protein [Acidobacteriota bacterium]
MAATFVLSASPNTNAQTNNEGLANLQFNFLNPGARALGMGGAFVAMADDATTSLANPAGLLNLTQPEAGIELTSTRFENEIPWFGGTATAVLDTELHTLREFSYAFNPRSFPTTLSDLSFISFVFPIRPREIVLSVFYDGQTRYEREFHTSGIPVLDRRDGGILDKFFPVRSNLAYQQRLFGISASTRLGDRISIGGTVALAAFSIRSGTIRKPDSNDEIEQRLDGDDKRIGTTLGVTVRATNRLRIGAVYARRPAFHLTFAPDVRDRPGQALFSGPVKLDIPDRLALGLSWRARERLSINADLVRVMNSDLMRGYFNAFHHPDSPDPFRKIPDAGREFYEVRDGFELRAGMELVRIVHLRPLALRAGYWREPFHRMVRKEPDSSVVYDLAAPENWHYEPYTSRSFIESAHHATVGIGIAFASFSIDAGYDYSKPTRRLVLSGVYYF